MARAKSKAEPNSAKTSPAADKPPKKRRGRPPKSQAGSSATGSTASGSTAKKTPTNGRKKRRVGRPPKSQSAKVAKQATAKSRKVSAKTKKRVGRPPKTASAKAKASRTTVTAKKRVGRPRKTVAADDGRRIPVSAATARALTAVSRTSDALKKERAALADAVDASTAARVKARASGQKRDKTMAKKARQKVQRITEKVSVRRTAAREAKANVAKLKAQDLLDARMNNIEVRLRRAEEAATERIAAKLERQTEKFRAATLERLDKVEARKSKTRTRKAESDRAALLRKYEATVQAADETLVPKERKKRRRRRARSA